MGQYIIGQTSVIEKMPILTGKAILFSNRNVGIEGNISGWYSVLQIYVGSHTKDTKIKPALKKRNVLSLLWNEVKLTTFDIDDIKLQFSFVVFH